jgi:hypothetical protein
MGFRTVPFIVVAILGCFLLGFLVVADSPKNLMTQSRETEAVAALKFFRGYAKSDENFSRQFLDEMETLKATSSSSNDRETEKLSLKDFSESTFFTFGRSSKNLAFTA